MTQRYLILLTLVLTALSLQARAGLLDWFNDDYTETQYPIVLVHGMFGFDSIAGIDYFYQVADELASGGAEVYTVQVTALESNETRGEELLEQVQEIRAASGADKLNLIGHSQGAPTARYVASLEPGMIASVSSVGGVNWGSAVADEYAQSGVDASPVAQALADLIDWASGSDADEQDLDASIASLTTQGSEQFNEQYPEGVPDQYCGEGPEQAGNGVYYYSWTGISPQTHALDISDPLLVATSAAFEDEQNDGLVSRCSSHLGKTIRDDYQMNHLDEINQVTGLHDLEETDPVTVYRQQANRLKQKGL